MDMQRRRRIEVEMVGEVLIATFTDGKILDEQTIQAVGGQVLELPDQEGGFLHLVLDLARVELISGAFLGKLMTLRRMLEDRRIHLVLCGANEATFEVFNITRLTRVIDMCEDRSAALDYLRSGNRDLLLGR